MREDGENMQEEREESENKNGDIEEKEYHQIENEVTQVDKGKDDDETASWKPEEMEGKEDQGKDDAAIKDIKISLLVKHFVVFFSFKVLPLSQNQRLSRNIHPSRYS